ncbi:MAG: aminotransferase class I/II-fold pyridoxal phosphate-dependent enzyme [Streptosporangiaceae bacterium]
MHAVILAAGRGRRMEPLSSTRHKALLEVGGDTILGRALDSLVAAGVGVVTIVTGYRADDITAFVGPRYPGLDVRYVANERYETTNNIVSLALALESMPGDEDVILIECDLLFEPGLIADLVNGYAGQNVALVDRYRTGMDGTVVSIDQDCVAQVFPTSSQNADFHYEDKFKTLNIYRFDRDFCHRTLRPILTTYANHVDANCYYELVLGMLANIPAHRIVAHVVAESDWVEVDDPNDLAVAKFAFDPTARPALLDRAFGGHWSFGILDFSLPRNAYFPPPAMQAAMRHSLAEIITGYGSAQQILDEKLAHFLGCQPTHVHLLSGASQAYPLLREIYAGSRVAIPDPTFGEYARAFPQAIRYRDIPGTGPGPLDEVARQVDLMVLVNPNNPTGTTLATSGIYQLAARTPATQFLVDESFLPFSGQPSLVDVLESAPLPNVTVLTSLGKALGVPGLRLGFIYSPGTDDRDARRALASHLPVWGVNALAEYFIELTLKFRSDLAASIAATVEERARLTARLCEHPLVSRVYDSGANFVLVELNGPDVGRAAAVRADLLASSRIEVKDVSTKFADGLPRLRVAVRTREDNDRLLMALETLLTAVG